MDNAGNSVNFVSILSVYPRVGISRSASETNLDSICHQLVQLDITLGHGMFGYIATNCLVRQSAINSLGFHGPFNSILVITGR